MRNHYLDNLKWLVILVVVPLHCMQIYYPHLSHYVKGEPMEWIGTVFAVCEVWLMPLMFTISGICAMSAIKNKTFGTFAKGRFSGVVLPLLAGLVFVVPLQSYPGRLWHTGSGMGYFEHWFSYFVGETDMTGYAGGFGLSQYWFLLYLAVASFVFLLVFVIISRIKGRVSSANVPAVLLPLLFIFTSLAEPVGNIMGYSFGYYTAFLLLGAFVVSNDNVKLSLEKYRYVFLAVAAIVMTAYLYNLDVEMIDNYGGPLRHACAWACTLAALGLAGRYFDKTGRVRSFLSRVSFGIYQFHQTGLSWCACFAVGQGLAAAAEFFLILGAALTSGVGITLVLSHFKATSVLFALKRNIRFSTGADTVRR